MNQLSRIHGFRKIFSNSLRLYSSSEKALIEKDNKTGMVTLSLNQPPVNSLNGEFLNLICDTMKNFDKDESVRGVLLTSNFHGKVFSAGLNILDLFNKSDAYLTDFWTSVQEMFLDLYGFSKPLVLAVNGHAPAGGCAMALMSDYRVMQEGKTIGLNETKLGLVAPSFFTHIMVSAIGNRQAELALGLGSMFTAEDALKIGLVDEVCSLDEVHTVAKDQLTRFMRIPSLAFSMNKSVFREPALQRLRDNRKEDTAVFVQLVQKPQTQAAIGAYLEQLRKKS